MDSQQVFLVPQVPQLPPASSKVYQQQQQTTTQMVQQQQPQCSICGTTQKLLRCAKCKAIYYCSTDHQHLDWPTHKQECRALAKQRQINNRLQQLTNGCGAININAHTNSINSSSHETPNWSSNYTTLGYSNVQQSNLKSNNFMLGTYENEILNSKAETVTQITKRSEYMGSFDANSTTTDQMHNIMAQNALEPPYVFYDQSFNDNSYSYYQSVPTQLDDGPISQTIQSQNNVDGLQPQSSHQIETPQQQQQQIYLPQQQANLQYPVPELSNHLINQQEKSSSYQIGAAVVDDNLFENANGVLLNKMKNKVDL